MKKCLFIILIIVFNYKINLAQTGPAGVEASTKNVLWLRADAGTFSDLGTTPTTNGTTVRQWNDQSGNTKNAIQNTAAARPTYETNIFNGLPALRFDGAGDGILSSAVTTSNTATFFVVFRYFSLGFPNPGLLQGSPTGLGFSTSPSDKSLGMWVNSGTQRIWGRGTQTDNTTRSITQVTTLATNTTYIAANRYDGTNINQYVNNAISGTITYNNTLKSWTDIAIGTQGTETWNGHIAEVIVFNKSLNEAQRHIVDNFLSSKYNVALTSNDKYAGDTPANGNFDMRVAGVGAEASGSNPTFSASATQGLGIRTLSGLDNGDYILAGHASPTNSVINTDISGLTGANPGRWSRIWYLDVTNASTVIQADVEFDLVEGGMAGTTPAIASNYVLLYRATNSGAWSVKATASSISGNRVVFSAINFNNNSDDGYYTIGTRDNTSSPLPIELISFNAELLEKQVDINWTTATEINNNYFTIERSSDGVSFEAIKKVKAAGNSNSVINYKEIDYSPLTDISYYRLKQTDNNDTYTYSKIIAVNNQHNIEQIRVFPNPTEGVFNIELKGFDNQQVQVIVKDITGKEYFSYAVNALEESQIITIDFEEKLAKGVYFLQINSNYKQHNYKLIVK
jgi:hypothetical protein